MRWMLLLIVVSLGCTACDTLPKLGGKHDLVGDAREVHIHAPRQKVVVDVPHEQFCDLAPINEQACEIVDDRPLEPKSIEPPLGGKSITPEDIERLIQERLAEQSSVEVTTQRVIAPTSAPIAPDTMTYGFGFDFDLRLKRRRSAETAFTETQVPAIQASHYRAASQTAATQQRELLLQLLEQLQATNAASGASADGATKEKCATPSLAEKHAAENQAAMVQMLQQLQAMEAKLRATEAELRKVNGN